MAVIYYRLIKAGVKTIDDVPTTELKQAVQALLAADENEATD